MSEAVTMPSLITMTSIDSIMLARDTQIDSGFKTKSLSLEKSLKKFLESKQDYLFFVFN